MIKYLKKYFTKSYFSIKILCKYFDLVIVHYNLIMRILSNFFFQLFEIVVFYQEICYSISKLILVRKYAIRIIPLTQTFNLPFFSPILLNSFHNSFTIIFIHHDHFYDGYRYVLNQ